MSSGVGKPATLRDNDIEILFPYKADEQAIDGWPPPFSPLIRIVHLYGRVADALNNIKGVSQVTPEFMKRLAAMEEDLTGSSHAKSKRVQVTGCCWNLPVLVAKTPFQMRQISSTQPELPLSDEHGGIRRTQLAGFTFLSGEMVPWLRTVAARCVELLKRDAGQREWHINQHTRIRSAR